VSDESRMPRLLAFYQEYLDNPETAIFAEKVSRHYTPATLQRLAKHEQRQIRRAAVLALGLVGDYESNATLGVALLDHDRTVRILAETSIRRVWAHYGTEADRTQLSAVVRMNSAGQFGKAIRLATRLIERTPGCAEAWNQRAYAYHATGSFEESVRDCHEALEINPYHFIAAVGLGRAYLELGNPLSALESFRRALRLNPDLEGVRAQVERLTRLVEGK
jgi:tetratricopeptide (TPR) repeat protein